MQLTTHNKEGKAVVKSTTPVKVCPLVDEIVMDDITAGGARPFPPSPPPPSPSRF